MTVAHGTQRHGTRYRYDLGCRCPACRDAKFAARRDSRARARVARSPSYLRELEANRRRHESYRGTCEACGAATAGCYGPGKAPTRCMRCAPALSGMARRGTGPVIGEALAFIAYGERSWSEIRDHLGITKGQMAELCDRLLRYGLVVRVARGRYVLRDA